MRQIVQFIILVSFTSNITAQIVNIPDPILKYQLITFPIADLGNGFNEIADTNGDGQIQVSEAEAVLGLQLVEQSIADLEGLQYFINMEIIDCSQNGLIDYIPTTFWPNLVYLESDANNIVNIDVTQNPLLEVLILDFNPLTSLDVAQNSLLKELSLSGCQLSNLDVTQNPILEILHCNGNQLTSLDIQNENNNLLWSMISVENPNLTCIQVDDVQYANNQSNWHKDEIAIYSEDCNLSLNETELQQIINIYPNPAKESIYIEIAENIEIEKITIYDILGKIVLTEKNSFNKLNLSDLNSGILFIKIETEYGTITKKLIKE